MAVRPLPFGALAFGAAVTFTASFAFAGDAERERADALFRSARELVKSGRLEDACPLFAESLGLDPAPGTRLSYADCEERLGHLARAYAGYMGLASLPPGDARASYARERAIALRSRIGLLRLPSSRAPRRVTVDGETRAEADVIPVDAGEHRVMVEPVDRTAQSVRSRELIVVVQAGETKDVDEEAPSPIAPGVSDRAPRRDASPAAAPVGEMAAVGFVVGGLGIAALGVGVVGGLLVGSDSSTYKEHCSARGCDAEGLDAANRGLVWRWVSPVALAVGAAAVTAGVYLVLSTPRRSTAIARAGVGASGQNGAPTLTLRGTF